METLLVINSILVGISAYFLKNFHTEFKELSKKVGRLGEKVKGISVKINSRFRSNKLR